MKRQDDCRVALKTQAVAALSDTPEVGHRWSEEAETLTLEIPRIEPDGFDVAVTASKSEILVIAGRMHSHFDWQSTAEEACIDALGLVRDLLSPGMRLVETSAGGRPYRWDLEVFDDGRWRLEESCGLLLYNYFGRRSTRVLQNTHLPSRFAA
jgi:hypothetical protein